MSRFYLLGAPFSPGVLMVVVIPRNKICSGGYSSVGRARIVIPVVVGSNPISHPIIRSCDNAKVAELVDALASGVSVLTDVGVQVPPPHHDFKELN